MDSCTEQEDMDNEGGCNLIEVKSTLCIQQI